MLGPDYVCNGEPQPIKIQKIQKKEKKIVDNYWGKVSVITGKILKTK